MSDPTGTFARLEVIARSYKFLSTAIVGEHIPEHLLEQASDDSGELPAQIVKKSDLNVDDSRQPFVCGNSSMVPPDPKKTYGHFVRKVIVQRKLLQICLWNLKKKLMGVLL